MQDSKIALAEPMLQDAVSRGVQCGWKRAAVLSLLVGFSVVMLGWAPSTAEQMLPAQAPLNAIAWPYKAPVTSKQSKFAQPTKWMSLTPMKAQSVTNNVHRLIYGPPADPLSAAPLQVKSSMLQGSEPEPQPKLPSKEEEPEIQENNIVETSQSDPVTRRNALVGALTAAAFTMDGATRKAIQQVGGQAIDTIREAVDRPKIVVAGATGLLGSRVIERLAARGGLDVVGGVHNLNKAKKVFKGFLDSMPDVLDVMPSMPSIPSAAADSAVSLAKLDVVKESVEVLAQTMKGASALVIAIGFVPGEPGFGFTEWRKAAQAVDNEGTIKLIDAAKVAGVSKVVMVSAILTDARAWGQGKATVYKFTNFFGGVLDQKLVAENHLRASGLDYSIIRAGGYIENGFRSSKGGELVISGENTIKEGEISRDRVAEVAVDALFDPSFNNKVVEIVEKFA